MCYLRASVLFISFRFFTLFSFLFFFFCFVSFLTILFSFFCVSFFCVSFRYFSPCFLFVFFSFRFFSFLFVFFRFSVYRYPVFSLFLSGLRWFISMFCSWFLYWNIIWSILWNKNISEWLHHTFGISNYLVFKPKDWPLWTLEKKKLFELSYLLTRYRIDLRAISYIDLKNRNAMFKWHDIVSNRF